MEAPLKTIFDKTYGVVQRMVEGRWGGEVKDETFGRGEKQISSRRLSSWPSLYAISTRMRVRIFDLRLTSKGQAKARSTKKISYRDKCRPAVAAAAVGVVAAANVDTAHGISRLD